MVKKTAFMIEFEAKEVEILQKRFKKQKWTKFISVRDYSNIHSSKIKKLDLYDLNDNIIPYNEVVSDEEVQASFRDDYVINHYKSIEQYRQSCLSNEATRWNVWNFTFYPSGEYESEFIWYNETHLDTLKTGVTSWFRFIYEKACQRIQDRCGQLPTNYPALVEMTVTFDTLGISQPALFHTENNPKMTFKLHLEQLYFFNERPYEEIFAEYDAICEREKGDITTANQKHYRMMNEGELKGVFPRWNKLTFTIDPNRVYISSEEVMERLKFEWLPENEA